MRSLAALVLLFVSLPLLAQTRAVQVSAPHEFVTGHVTAFLDSGEVIHVPVEKLETVEHLKRSLYLGDTLSFESNSVSDEAPVVEDITATPAELRGDDKEMHDPARFRSIQWGGFDPLEKANLSTLSDYNAAQRIMDGMNGATDDDSQCYNRAHMWTYEALVNQRVNLGKLWIFFTKKYIREHRYKWWFHVAPYTEVGQERFRYMLDRGFTMIPYTVENWKNIFMKNQANCPVVTNYRAYEEHQEEAYCYLIYSSQYYWQPWQVKKLDVEGQHFYGYHNSELRIAYRDALKRWDGDIPVLRNPLPNPEIGNPNPNPNPRPNPNPNPNPNPRPNPTQGYAAPLNNGDVVLYQRDLYRRVRVIYAANDTYDIQFQDGGFEVLRNVPRKELAVFTGCAGDLCTNYRVLNVALTDEIVYNRIVAITVDGLFVVSFEEGRSLGGRSWGWHESYFARTQGCMNGWCVGDFAYSHILQGQVRILGVHPQGFTLEVNSGPRFNTRVKYYRDLLTRI